MAVMKFKPLILDKADDEETLAAKHELWRMGDLSWKLRGKQLDLYEEITNQIRSVSTNLCSRRFGKSTSNLVASMEVCIQHPLAIVKYACPTQKMVKDIILPILRLLTYDAPPEYQIDNMWTSDNKVMFPNGSFISVAGTDNGNAEALRGAYAHLIFADEAAFMDNLGYVIKSILLPQLDTTGGKLIMTSTPNPLIPHHEFHTMFVAPAEANGSLIKFTIRDSALLTKEEQDAIIERNGGENDSTVRVEYFVEVPKNTEASVVSEFYKNKEAIVTADLVRPQYYDTYTSGDIGVKDLTVFLFGYYDFKEATLVILDEWVMNGMEMTTTTIAENIKTKEELHYTEANGKFVTPLRRPMDNDLKLINDLRILHDLNFLATKKDNKAGAVNQLRVLIEEGRLKIHPRCKHLIYHVENAQWKEGKSTGKEFAHLPDSIDGDIRGGHADALDALIYMVRNILYNHNPYPDSTVAVSENQHQSSAIPKQESSVASAMKNILGLRRK